MSVALRLQRAPMLLQLRDHLLSPEAGSIRVQGPKGIGKTSLMFELYRQLRAEPGILVGACRFECLEEPPLFPIMGALGEAIGGWLLKTRIPVEALAERMPPMLVPWSRAFLRFCLALGSQSGTGEPGSRWRLREVADAHISLEKSYLEERALFDDSLARLMVTLIREARLRQSSSRFVLIFDQVEFAGRRSRALLELLFSLPPSVSSVVVSVDAQDGLPSIPMPSGLHGLQAFELAPLSSDELVGLYESWGGNDPRQLEAGALLEATRGNPLAARFLVLAERFHQPFDVARPLADGHMRPLLTMLSGPARDLVGILALLPVPLYFGRLDWAELLQVDASTVEPLVQSLVQQGFLGTYPRTLVFSHARHREIVAADLSDDERMALGTRLAKFIEIQYGRDLERGCVLPVLSAFHAGIGLAGELLTWLKTAIELCEGWYALGEWEQAWTYCERLFEYADLLEPGERSRLLNIVGMVAYQLQRWGEAGEAFSRARTLALSDGDEALAHLIGLNLGGVSLGRGELDAARAAYRGVIEIATAHDDQELAWQAWAQLAVCESRTGASMESLTAYMQAIKGAEQSDHPGEAARMKQDLAELLLAHAQLDAGQVWLKQGIEDFRHLKDRASEAHLLGRLAMVYEFQQQIAQSEHCWIEAMACVEEDGQAEAVWCTISNNYGSFLHRIGRCDDAVQILQQALEVARIAGRTSHEARILNNLAMLCESLGASQLALEHARNSLRIKQRIGDRRGVAVGRNNLGTLLFGLRQLDEALSEFQQSLELWRLLEDVPGESITLNNLAMLHERRGEYEKALRCYRSSLALKEMLQDPGAVRHTLTNMVLFLDELKRFSTAEDCMRALISLDRMTNHPDLSQEEQYLAFLTEKARERPSGDS